MIKRWNEARRNMAGEVVNITAFMATGKVFREGPYGDNLTACAKKPEARRLRLTVGKGPEGRWTNVTMFAHPGAQGQTENIRKLDGLGHAAIISVTGRVVASKRADGSPDEIYYIDWVEVEYKGRVAESAAPAPAPAEAPVPGAEGFGIEPVF
jgi:hypothetical protein